MGAGAAGNSLSRTKIIASIRNTLSLRSGTSRGRASEGSADDACDTLSPDYMIVEVVSACLRANADRADVIAQLNPLVQQFALSRLHLSYPTCANICAAEGIGVLCQADGHLKALIDTLDTRYSAFKQGDIQEQDLVPLQLPVRYFSFSFEREQRTKMMFQYLTSTANVMPAIDTSLTREEVCACRPHGRRRA